MSLAMASTAAAGSTATPPPPVFHLFAELPIELRLKIWRFCMAGPRILKTTYETSLGQYVCSTPPPITLSINQEARAQTLRNYTYLRLTSRGQLAPIPIDFGRDTVYLSELGPILQTHLHELLYNLSTSEARHRVRALAIDRRVWNELCDNGLLGCLCRMRSLRDVCMVVEFGREFVGDLAFLDTPDWRGDLRWLAQNAEGQLAEERRKFAGLRRGLGCAEMEGSIKVKCVILMRGGEQA
ncbi:hypothetical protein PVAG01_03049 [Phlyctema vagabunda]|uniref:2EXR domain-containing protein n=1 Tax=Phlyctema vagabunda TaxID=108571 RepID=A0ABR4PSA6_9HELO